jgi:hypothetical protein
MRRRRALPAEIWKKFGLRAICQVSPDPDVGDFKDIKELLLRKNLDLQIFIWAERGKSEGCKQQNSENAFPRDILTPSPSFHSAEHSSGWDGKAGMSRKCFL